MFIRRDTRQDHAGAPTADAELVAGRIVKAVTEPVAGYMLQCVQAVGCAGGRTVLLPPTCALTKHRPLPWVARLAEEQEVFFHRHQILVESLPTSMVRVSCFAVATGTLWLSMVPDD